MENESGQDVVEKEKNKKPFRRGWIIVWLGLLALMLLLALGLVRAQQGSVNVGQKVPDFSLTTFDGEEILLSELEGKVVLVNLQIFKNTSKRINQKLKNWVKGLLKMLVVKQVN